MEAATASQIAYVVSPGHAVSLDVRYSTGFTNVSPADVDASIQNEVFSVGVGYTLSL